MIKSKNKKILAAMVAGMAVYTNVANLSAFEYRDQNSHMYGGGGPLTMGGSSSDNSSGGTSSQSGSSSSTSKPSSSSGSSGAGTSNSSAENSQPSTTSENSSEASTQKPGSMNESGFDAATKQTRESMKERMPQLEKKAEGGIKKFLSNVNNFFSNGFKKVVSSVTGFFNNVSSTVKNFVSKIFPKKTVGDPVFITEGKFYTNDIDLSFNYGSSVFDVNRDYASQEYPDGVFGKNWSSIFDSRIIRGTGSSLLSSLKSTLSSCEEDYNLNLKIMESNRVGVNTVPETAEARNRIDQLKNLISNFEKYKKKNPELNKYSVHGFESVVNEMTPLSLLFVDSDGALHNFVYSTELNKYNEVGGKNGAGFFIENNGDGFVVNYPDGTKKYFDEWGMITKIEDKFSSAVTFEYYDSIENNVRRVQSVSENNNPVLDIKWTDNRISKITDIRRNISVEYNYDENGSLVDYKDSDGDSYGYVYDASCDLVKIVKSDGSFTKIDYSINGSTKEKRVSAVTNEEGYSEYFSIDKTLGKTTYVDPDGNIYVYNYDDNKITQEDLPLGYSVSRTYNEDGLVKKLSSPYESVEYSYDEYKNLVRAKYSDGTAESWNFTQPYNLLSSYIDRDGIKTEFAYSINGGLEKISRAGTVIQTYKRDSAGRVLSANGINLTDEFGYDSNGLIVSDSKGTYSYDSRDRVVSYTSKDGYVWNFGYSDDNKIQTATLPGNLYEKNEFNSRKDLVKKTQKNLVTGDTRIFEYEYDLRHLVTKVKSGFGKDSETAEKQIRLSKSFEYYPSGKLKTLIEWNSGDAVELDAAGVKRTYTYEKDNISSIVVSFVDESGTEIGKSFEKKYSVKYSEGKKWMTITNGLGKSTVVKFNQFDDPVSLTDACGRSVAREYSAAGVLKSEKKAQGGKIKYGWNPVCNKVSSISDSNSKIVEYSYDSTGRLISENLVNGERNLFGYTENDGATTVTQKSANCKIENTYDSNGLETAVKVFDGNGKKIYDKKVALNKINNRVCQTIGDVNFENTMTAWGDVLENITTGTKYSYDEKGNCISIDDGNKIINLSYNVFNKISSVNIGNKFVKYCYDAAGNLIRVFDNVGTISEFEYDAAGNLICEKGRVKPERKYEYDDAGNLTKVFEAGQLIKSIAYSTDLKQEIITDAKGASRVTEYDDYGNLKSVLDRLGNKRSVSFNNAKGSVTYNDFNGNKISVEKSASGNFLNTAYSDGTIDKIFYDAMGSISEMSNRFGAQKYSYNNAHQLESAYDGTHRIDYGYDEHGRLSSLVTNGREFKYEYFNDNLVKSVSQGDFSRVFSYDDLGQIVSSSDSTGSKICYEYDVIGRPVLTYQKDYLGNIVYVDGTVYGDDGRVVCTFDKDGLITTYEYDLHGRVSKVSMPFFQSCLDDANEELAECGKTKCLSVSLEVLPVDSSVKNTVQKALRKIGLSADKNYGNQKAWTETYEYDLNGNRISKKTPAGKMEYEYDAENRLVKIVGPSAVVISYDANGNMLSRKSSLVSQEWMYSQNNRVVSSSYSNYGRDSYYSSEYGYDCLGRRLYTKDSNGKNVHTLYDGFSFDKIYEWQDKNNAYASQLSINANNSKIRYRDIDSQHSVERSYRANSSNSGCLFDRYYVYANGNLAAQFNEGYSYTKDKIVNEEMFAFCTDNRGSICHALGRNGDSAYGVHYGLNGQPYFSVEKNKTGFVTTETAASFGADIGFNGKSYDLINRTYNYGFRDYSPSLAEFVTEDPIQDGENWYGYCKGDPINYTDLLGLKNIPADMTGTMNDYGRDVVLGNSNTIYMHQQGCYVTTLSGIINAVKKKKGDDRYTPLTLNDEKSNFAQNSQCVVTDSVCKNYNVKYDEYIWGYNYNQIAAKINELDNSSEEYCLAVKLFITYGRNKNTSEHWVSTEGKTKQINGKEYVKVIGSNKTDNGDCRYGWVDKDGESYAPINQIIGLRAFRNDEPEVEIVQTKNHKIATAKKIVDSMKAKKNK